MKRNTVGWRAGFLALVLLVLAGVPAAHAFEAMEGGDVVIDADEVIEDDLYVAAERFVLEGTITGDLVVAGQSIVIDGTVEGDLIAAGRDITLNGSVMDDIRMAGAALTIGSGALVGDDLVATGYSLEAREESGIGGNVIFAGKQALIGGTVGEDMRFAGVGLSLQGTIEGDVQAAVGTPDQGEAEFIPEFFGQDMPPVPEVENGLRLGKDASIGGDLEYASEDHIATIPPEQVGGTIEQVRAPDFDFADEPSFFGQLLYHVQRLLLLALVAVVLAWWFPVKLRRLASRIETKPLPTVGWGIVILVGVPLALVGVMIVFGILAIVLGFMAFGLGLMLILPVLLTFLVVVFYLAKVVVGYLGGRMLLARFKPELSEGVIWPALVGVVLVGVLTIIPAVGGILNLLVMVAGLGALWLFWREGRAKQQAESLKSA